jgi:hypothetical protein
MSRNDQTWRNAEREADVAAVLRLGRYAQGEASAVERDDVRRVLAILAAAMFQPTKESTK